MTISRDSVLREFTHQEIVDYLARKDRSITSSPLFEKALDLFEGEVGQAIDLGCGVGFETAMLVRKGWNVIAVDVLECARNYLFNRIPAENKDRVEFILTKIEDYTFPHQLNLVNALFVLPFCEPEKFKTVIQSIKSTIAIQGRFVGTFFGFKDDWVGKRKMIFMNNETLSELFQDFTIEFQNDFEIDRQNGEEMKHYHILEIIAKKV